MKKLILKYREKGDYFLLERTENSESVIGEIEPKNEFPYSLPLSKKNCDELFGIYNPSELSKPLVQAERGAFEFGYCLAREHNSEKMFTLEDMQKAHTLGWDSSEQWNQGNSKITELSELIKSLQQPTEIEVEFEMQETEPAGENVWMSPKLDENGILILKRK